MTGRPRCAGSRRDDAGGGRRHGRHRRRRRARLDAGGRGRRQADPAREQGSPGARRHACCSTRARRSGATILPIDSEHNAIFQCLPPGAATGSPPAGVSRILLTASGGPFLRTRREDLAAVTPEQAIAHPNWRMGPKISVDSATLMNKGLELIEACHLFGRRTRRGTRRDPSPEHRAFAGGVRRRLGARADELSPTCACRSRRRSAGRIASPRGRRAWTSCKIARLSFEDPDFERFPCLGLAQYAARAGGTMPAVLNAANEVAVAAFLGRRLNFASIATVIECVLQQHEAGPVRALKMRSRPTPGRASVRLRALASRSRRPAHERRHPDLHRRLHRRDRRPGDGARVRPFLGRAPPRLQGPALLDRLRQAARCGA